MLGPVSNTVYGMQDIRKFLEISLKSLNTEYMFPPPALFSHSY